MINTAPQTNAAGFVRFNNRSQSYRGDRYTWARYDSETRQLTVNLARSGRVSDEYWTEFAAFCSSYGIDHNSLRHGEPVTITLPDPAESESLESAENTETAAEQNAEAAAPRLDAESLRISRAEYAAFSDGADQEIRNAHRMAMRRALDLQRAGDMAGSEAAVLEGALIVRRWTINNEPNQQNGGSMSSNADLTCPVCGGSMSVTDLQYEDGEHLSFCPHCEGINEAARIASETAHNLLAKARGPRCRLCDAPLAAEDVADGVRVCPRCAQEVSSTSPF